MLLLQSCPTLCDPIDGSPPSSAVPGILQARTLEWVAIAFSIVWKWKVKVKSLSRVWLVATPWTAAYQAPPSMGFSRQEYWSGLPLPSLNKICYRIVNKNSSVHLIRSREYHYGVEIWGNSWKRIWLLRVEFHQNWKRPVYPNVHRSTVYNSQDMEAT